MPEIPDIGTLITAGVGFASGWGYSYVWNSLLDDVSTDDPKKNAIERADLANAGINLPGPITPELRINFNISLAKQVGLVGVAFMAAALVAETVGLQPIADKLRPLAASMLFVCGWNLKNAFLGRLALRGK